MEKSKNIPQLRFDGFDGEWSSHSLSRFANRIKRKNEHLESDLVMTISAHHGLISQLEFFNKRIASANLRGYYLMKKGEFTYNKSYSSEYPWGAVKRLDRYEMGVVSNLYIVFEAVDIVSDFLVTYYDTNKWHREIAGRAKEGARNHGLLNISAEDFLSSHFLIPDSLQEQTEIGNLFTTISKQISSQRKTCEKLRNLKEALLVSLFPQGSEKQPRIRLDGFSGDWECHSLSEYTNRVKRKNSNNESDNVMTISASYGLINQSEFYNKRIASADISGYYLMHKGEFAYNKSYSSDYPWGAVKRLDKYEEGVVSNLYIIFEVEKIDSDFVVCYFMTNLWHKAVSLCAKEGARNHGLLNISADDFLNIPVLIPPTIQEQEAIAAIFMEQDRLIRLNEQKLEKLRNLKQAMLDKMFV